MTDIPLHENVALSAAMAYLDAGLSVVPIKVDGSKAAAVSWKRYQRERLGETEARRLFAGNVGIAVIGGSVSGNLECLDFDHQAETIYPAWCELVEAERAGLVAKLSVARTPKPGFHVRYRCTEPIPGNTDLAFDGKAVLIQTRGEGGYAIAPGSPSACHPTGRLYEHHSGPKLTQIGTITAVEREILIRCAKSFNRSVFDSFDKFDKNFRPQRRGHGDGQAVEDEFNRRTSWAGILEPHGWKKVRQSGAVTYWQRPGKHDEGHSATTGYCRGKDGSDLLAVFSSNAAPFEGPAGGKNSTPYGKFRAYATLNHGGDYRATVAELRRQGFGNTTPPASTNGNGHTNGRHSTNGTPAEVLGLATRCLATVQPAPVRWLVPEYLPLGKLVLIAGDGGHGKSSLTLNLAACLSTGRQCLGLDYEALPPAEVLLISCEDDLGDTVVPRLLAAGADLTRIHHVHGIKVKDGKTAPFSLAHFEHMQAELEARPQTKLVVIDPAGAYVGRSGVDDHKDSELRSLLQPMADLAAKLKVTIILVKHFNKGATVKAVHKVSGSAGYVNACRAAFVVIADQDDEKKKLFLPIKFNLGPKPSGLAYRLQPLGPEQSEEILSAYAGHLGSQDQVELARQLFEVRWEGKVSIDADDAVSSVAKPERGPGKVEQAKEWLKSFLGAFAWPGEEVLAAGAEAGHTRHNLFEAKKGLNIPGRKMGFTGAWYWG